MILETKAKDFPSVLRFRFIFDNAGNANCYSTYALSSVECLSRLLSGLFLQFESPQVRSIEELLLLNIPGK